MKKRITIVMTLVCALCMLFAAACSQTTVTKFTVSFDTNGGTEIASVEVEQGEKITKPEDPSKAHYVFGGWFSGEAEWAFDTDTVTKDVTLTAKWTPEVYSVTFKNHDGTELAKENVSYGSAPKYSTVPEKTGDKQYSYTFAGWEDESGKIADLTKIDRNIVLTAKFTSVVNKYKVVFKNGNDVLKEYNEEYGKVPKAPETDPQKEGNAQYSYTFKGWDKALTAVTGDVVYTAEFKETLNKYKVTFKNGDTVLKQETLDYGTMPTAPETNPTKAADAQYTYTFKGWDKTIGEVTGDVVYTAEFKETLNKYKVTFKNGDTVLKQETLDYGTMPTAPEDIPTKAADAQYTYTFKGWDKTIGEVTGDVVYNAEFKETLNQYKITFKNGDTTLKEETLDYGATPTAPETTPTKGYDSENHYTFKGWDKDISAVKGETVYSAQFNAVKHDYTVDSSDETTDYILCSCGYKDESYSYDKTVTSARKELVVSASGLSLTIEGATAYESVEKMVINGSEISGSIDSFELPAAVQSDTQRHGEQTIVVTVKDARGFAHELKVPVLLITKEIASLDDLIAALTGSGEETAIYGYYRLATDLKSTSNKINISGRGDWINEDGQSGFRGIFDGNKKEISGWSTINGLFGIVGEGAVIKNLTYTLTAYEASGNAIARSITGATVENVTINVSGTKTTVSIDKDGGVITGLMSQTTLYKNVTINAVGQDIDSLFGHSHDNYKAENANTFINCVVKVKSLAGLINSNGAVPAGGIDGLKIIAHRDDETATEKYVIGKEFVYNLDDIENVLSITLDGEDFGANCSFEDGVLTINADAFTEDEVGVKTLTIVAQNSIGYEIEFGFIFTVKIDSIEIVEVKDVVIGSGNAYKVDLGEYSNVNVATATLADEAVTYSNGTLTITDEIRTNKQKHGEHELKLITEDGGVITARVLLITKEIGSKDDWSVFGGANYTDKVLYGYYRLSADIKEANGSAAWLTGGIDYYTSKGIEGFRGTLDGNGYTVYTVPYSTGLLGDVGSGAVIKNINIISATYDTSYNKIIGRRMWGATLDNVTITVPSTCTGTDPKTAYGLITGLYCYETTFNNVVIDVGTKFASLIGASCDSIYAFNNTFNGCTLKYKDDASLGLYANWEKDGALASSYPLSWVSGISLVKG